jgi:NAD+ kinase
MVSNLLKAPKLLKTVNVVFRRDPTQIRKTLTANGFEVVDSKPDFVICFGGDGTVLFAERKFPEIPKLIIKTSRACRKYDYVLDNLCDLLAKIKAGDYQIHSEIKLEATAKGEMLVGLNEIQVHLKLPIYAVRFSLSVNGKKCNDLIGDGVIIAAPFGSTAYYSATGGKSFEKGIGISFNNLHHKKIDSFVVSEDTVVTLVVSRGPAWLLADNNENFIELIAGDVVTVKKSPTAANFIYFPSL